MKNVIIKILEKMGEDSKENFKGCLFVGSLYIICAFLAFLLVHIEWWYMYISCICLVIGFYSLYDASVIYRRMQ